MAIQKQVDATAFATSVIATKWMKVQGGVDRIHLDLTVPDLKLMSPLEASISAVNYIVQNYPAPHVLFVSGGIDSQAMLYAWKKSGHPFKAISIQYNESLNKHDLAQLKAFALRERISITYQNFNLLSFLRHEYDEWAHKFQCSSPQIATYIRMSHDVEGTVIHSGNFLGKKGAFLSHALLALHRYAKTRPMVPFFFMETPEVAYSMLPYYELWDDELDVYTNKVLMYQVAGFPVIPQKDKFTGFEQVKNLYDIKHQHWITPEMKLAYASKPSNRAFDILLRYPYEKKFGNPKVISTMNPT